MEMVWCDRSVCVSSCVSLCTARTPMHKKKWNQLNRTTRSSRCISAERIHLSVVGGNSAQQLRVYTVCCFFLSNSATSNSIFAMAARSDLHRIPSPTQCPVQTCFLSPFQKHFIYLKTLFKFCQKFCCINNGTANSAPICMESKIDQIQGIFAAACVSCDYSSSLYREELQQRISFQPLHGGTSTHSNG